MDVTDDVVIMCSLVSWKAAHVVSGASVDFCSECHEKIWVAPSSLRMMKEVEDAGYEATVTCIPCGMIKQAEYSDDELELHLVTPEQEAEIAGEIGSEAAASLVASVNASIERHRQERASTSESDSTAPDGQNDRED